MGWKPGRWYCARMRRVLSPGSGNCSVVSSTTLTVDGMLVFVVGGGFVGAAPEKMVMVALFGEPMSKWKLFSFAVIWLALLIFTVSALREDRGRTLPVEDPTAA